MPHDSGTVHILALSLPEEWSPMLLPCLLLLPACRGRGCCGVSQPQLQGLEAAEGRCCHGQGELAGMSEEGSLLLEFIPLPQGQLAKLLGRHGKHPREVLC